MHFSKIKDYLKNLGTRSKIFYILFAFALVFFANRSAISLFNNISEHQVESSISQGLPQYNGSCPQLVQVANFDLQKATDFEQSPFVSTAVDTTQYKALYLRLVSVFNLAQFCEDNEAQGRVLYVAADIELVGVFRGTKNVKDVIPLLASYYNEAEHFGYNSKHPNEAFWLKSRIYRNALRAGLTIDERDKTLTIRR